MSLSSPAVNGVTTCAICESSFEHKQPKHTQASTEVAKIYKFMHNEFKVPACSLAEIPW